MPSRDSNAVTKVSGASGGRFCILDRLLAPIRCGAQFLFRQGNISNEARDLIAARAGTPYSIRRAFLLVALAATAAVAPMFFLGAPSGHDFQFHLASWADVAGQWREGIFYPRWAEWANWGYGEPRFIFYPPASWMLGAALDSLLPWVAAPVAYIWLALLACGMSMWKLAREWLSPPEAAAAAVFFAVNPYNLVVVYYRSDFAELLAGALFPLLVLGILRITREHWQGVPFLALVFAGIWLCNAPAAVIATYSATLLLVAGTVLTRSLRPLLAGGVAVAAGFGLAAFYILPAAWEQKWVQIGQAVSQNLRPEQNFIFTHAGDPEFILFNWKVSGLALGVMLVTGILGVFVARRRCEFAQLWWMLVTVGACSVFFMFSPSEIFWRSLPELRFVQFPWRWLEGLSVVFAFFTAAAMGASRKRWALWLAILAVLGATATAIAKDTWWDSDDPSTIADWIHSGDGYEGTDEYAPRGCDRYELPGVNPDSEQPPANPVPMFAKFDPASETISPAAGVILHAEKWTAERRTLSEESPAPVELALRIVKYPAWEARIDGQPVAIAAAPNTDEMLLPLAGGAHRIELRFRRTRDRTVGDLISIVFGIVLCLWSRIRRLVPPHDGPASISFATETAETQQTGPNRGSESHP
jgi:6-pyruvoyl-tetrahydropterin synthase related domain